MKDVVKTPKDRLEKEYKKLPSPKELSEGEKEERLEATGQESEKKGIKWTGEELREEEKKEKLRFNNELEWLTYKRKFKDEEYLVALASVLWHKLKKVDWPLGFHYKVEIEGLKLKASFRDNYNRNFARGIKVSGIPKYDHRGVESLAIQAENTVDGIFKYEELRKTKGGIILP